MPRPPWLFVLLFGVLPIGRAFPVSAQGSAPRVPTAQSQADALRESKKIHDPGTRKLVQYALTSANLKAYPAIFALPVFSRDAKTLMYTSYLEPTTACTRVLRLQNGQVKSVFVRKASSGSKAPPFLSSEGAAFSPDGSLLATIESRPASSTPGIAPNASSIWLWSTRTWKIVRVLKGHFHSISSLSFSADGRRLLSGDKGGEAIIHDVRTGKVLTDWHLNNEYKRLFVAFRQNGDKEQALALTANNYTSWGLGDGSEEEAGRAAPTQLWDVETEKLVHEFATSPDARLSAFSPGASTIAIAGYSGSTPDLKPITYLQTAQMTNLAQETNWKIRDYYYIASLTFTPDGKNLLASALGGDYQFLQVYDLNTPPPTDENSSVPASG